MAINNSLLKGRWTIWVLSLIFSLAAGYGVLQLVGQAAEQVPYYVISQDIPAQTLITTDVLAQKVSNADGVPPNAITRGELESQAWYSKVPLRRGDVVSTTVLATGSRIIEGLPPEFVAVSLAVPPENAVGGRITRGDYIDVAAVIETAEAGTVGKVVLQNVLVLDVSVVPETIASAAVADPDNLNPTNAEGNLALREGIPQLYILAVSPKDYATLALLRSNQIYLALSQGLDAPPSGAAVSLFEIFGQQNIQSSGEGTENTILFQNEGEEAVPETPATPTTPETPATPATPETPATPATPETPSTPATP